MIQVFPFKTPSPGVMTGIPLIPEKHKYYPRRLYQRGYARQFPGFLPGQVQEYIGIRTSLL